MNSMKTCLVIVFCLTSTVAGQHYEADYTTFNDYSDGHNEGIDDGDSGFVTPLDFSPLYGSGLSAAASNPDEDVIPAASDAQPTVLKLESSLPLERQDYFLAQSSDRAFSPESFGYKTRRSSSAHARYQRNVESQESKLSPELKSPLSHEKDFDYEPEGESSQPGDVYHPIPVSKYQKFRPSKKLIGKSQALTATTDFGPSYTDDIFPDSYSFTDFSEADFKPFRYKRYTERGRQQAPERKNAPKKQKEAYTPYNYRQNYRAEPLKEYDERESYESPDFSFIDDKADLKKYEYNPDDRNYGVDEKADLKAYDYGADVDYHHDDYDRIKSISEKQAEEARKNPENCKEIKKDSMTCTICTDPKNGGNYESCQYVSEPKNSKYAYAHEQKYDKDGLPVESPKDKANDTKQNSDAPQNTKSEENYNNDEEKSKPSQAPPHKNVPVARPERIEKYHPVVRPERIERYQPIVKPERSEKYQAVVKPERPERYQPSPSNRNFQRQQRQPGYENYYNPGAQDNRPRQYEHYQQEPSQDDAGEDYEYQADLPEFFAETNQKKNVENVLAEFARKDRSECKKVLKNEMTCFQCTDKTGLKNEECMYVSESAPKSSHLAYKEVKEFNSKPGSKNAQHAGSQGAESQVVSTSDEAPKDFNVTSTATPAADSEGKPSKTLLFKKYYNKAATPDSTEGITKSETKYSSQYVQVPTAASKTGGPVKRNIKYNGRKVRILKEVNSSDTEPSASSNKDSIASPSDALHDSFWAESSPVNSKKYSTAVPAYMLSKSEEEILLDEFFSTYKK